MPKHQMILSERQIAALADACNIDVRHIEKHADEEFGNQLDAFAQAVAEDVIKQTIALFDYDESMSVIKNHELTWTYDVSLDAMKELIAKDLGIPVSEVSVEYVIGDIGPGDPLDRYPAPRGVTGVKVRHTQRRS